MPAEERKLATVLFADLVGSTELAADEDAERVRALLDRFYDSMAAEIDRVGGTVEKFVGDAVMAAFGAPAAHEDDAGLRLVDPHDWSFRTIDPQASQVQRAGGLLLAQGAGLSVSTLRGREQYRLFDGRSVSAFAHGDRLFATVRVTRAKSRTFVFDLASGQVVGTASTPVWSLLIDAAAPPAG